MSWWSEAKRKLGVSLGLLGKPFLVNNLERRFGEAPQYWAVQFEWPVDYDDEKLKGQEVVVLITPFELERMLKRAQKNPEDVARFLKDHELADMVD